MDEDTVGIDLTIDLPKWWSLLVAYGLGLASLTVARSLVSAGSVGIIHGCRMAMGWHTYKKGKRDVISVSLNTLRDGKLTVDSLVEELPLVQVWNNLWQCQRVKKLAKKCTPESPVVVFRPEEMKHYYKPLRTLVAARIPDTGSIDLAIADGINRMKPAEHRFVLILTYEPMDDRVHKFRLMMVSRDELQKLAQMALQHDRPERYICVEEPEYESRVRTLFTIAKMYQDDPDQFMELKLWRFMRVHKEKNDVG